MEYVKGNTKGYSNRIIYVVEKYRTLIKNLMKPGFYDIVFAEFDQVVTDFPSSREIKKEEKWENVVPKDVNYSRSSRRSR